MTTFRHPHERDDRFAFIQSPRRTSNDGGPGNRGQRTVNNPTAALGAAQDDALERVLAKQISNTRQRMERSGHLYPEEYAEAVAGAAHVRRLSGELDLGTFLRTLTPTSGKPRFLLVFATRGEREVVLKVYGRRRPGEISLVRLWNRVGIRAVEVIDGGNDPASWLLMTPIPSARLTSEPMRGLPLLGLTRELASSLSDAHLIPLPAGDIDLLTYQGYRRFGPAIQRHLAVVLSTLAAHGYNVRADWKQIANALAVHTRSVLLHGDLSVGNVLRHAGDGQLRLLDPAAYLGPPEFDAARWAARTGGAEEGEDALAAWLDSERNLNAGYARKLLGLELLMEAGVRELVKDEEAQEPRFPDEQTLNLLTTADRLLPSNRITQGSCVRTELGLATGAMAPSRSELRNGRTRNEYPTQVGLNSDDRPSTHPQHRAQPPAAPAGEAAMTVSAGSADNADRKTPTVPAPT